MELVVFGPCSFLDCWNICGLQMHGLGLSVKSRWIIMGVYSSLVMVVGFSFRGLEVLRDLIAIPHRLFINFCNILVYMVNYESH